MATPNTLEMGGLAIDRPPLPSERWPEYFDYSNRVLAFFFRNHMEEPELVNGEIFDSFATPNPRPGDSLGMVHIRTPKSHANWTGRIIGIDMDSVGLITEDALPHLYDKDFRVAWLADGSEAWGGEASMLEEFLVEGIAKGTLGRRIEEPVATQEQPGRTRGHARTIPGLTIGRVGTQSPAYV